VEDRALLKLEEGGQERQYSDWPRTGDAFKPLQVQSPADFNVVKRPSDCNPGILI